MHNLGNPVLPCPLALLLCLLLYCTVGGMEAYEVPSSSHTPSLMRVLSEHTPYAAHPVMHLLCLLLCCAVQAHTIAEPIIATHTHTHPPLTYVNTPRVAYSFL
jgi:hypothetical protein